MTLVAFALYPVLGKRLAMQAATGNLPTISASTVLTTSPYEYVLSPVAGSDVTYLRLSGRNASTGIALGLSLNAPKCMLEFAIDSSGVHENMFILTDSSSALPIISLRRTAANKIAICDVGSMSSASPSATGSYTMLADTPYVAFLEPNCSAGTAVLDLYTASGTQVDSISVSGQNFNLDTVDRIFTTWGPGYETAAGGMPTWTGNASATFTTRYGRMFVDNASRLNINTRIGVLRPVADATYGGFTASTGTRVACVQADDSDYIRSVTSGEAASFTVQTFAQASISASSILAASPYGVYVDEGGAPTIGTRWRYNGTNYDTTLADPGPDSTFHLRGILYATNGPDAAALTQAKIEGSEIGCVRNAATTAVRCESLGINVAYVYTAPSSGSANGAKVNQQTVLLNYPNN